MFIMTSEGKANGLSELSSLLQLFQLTSIFWQIVLSSKLACIYKYFLSFIFSPVELCSIGLWVHGFHSNMEVPDTYTSEHIYHLSGVSWHSWLIFSAHFRYGFIHAYIHYFIYIYYDAPVHLLSCCPHPSWPLRSYCLCSFYRVW